MAKFKPAGKNKPKPSQMKGLIPCLILILAGIVLFTLFFYAMLKSSG